MDRTSKRPFQTFDLDLWPRGWGHENVRNSYLVIVSIRVQEIPFRSDGFGETSERLRTNRLTNRDIDTFDGRKIKPTFINPYFTHSGT